MTRILLTHWMMLMVFAVAAAAQENNPPPPSPARQGGPGGFGGGGPGGGGFMGGGPGGMGQQTEVLKKFDKDGDKKLNQAERKEAREFLAKEGGNRRRGGFGGFGGRGNQEPPKPGEKLTTADVKTYGKEPLYDSKVLRTFFLEFENSDWEKELADFKNTDVEVPAKLTVDGKTYENVGVHFRGMSSFMGVGEGRKRSLTISMDEWNKKQDLLGYNTLHLLNGHEDPSLLRVVLYDTIARAFLPAAKANYARVVINGESWGIYVNEQQFNKDFTKEWFGTGKGARWKVQGSPGGRGSLAYLGDDPAAYKKIYSIKTKDDKKSWAALIKLTRILNETPPEKLEAELSPIFDIDGALRFLAVENVLCNGDGYWIRTSDYNIYLDEKGKFHILPHDTNEGFVKPGGPGMGGGGIFAFSPGMLIGTQMMAQGDKDADKKLSSDEMKALAEMWFGKLDEAKVGEVSQEQYMKRLDQIMPFPQGFGPPDGIRGGGPQGGNGPPGRGRAPTFGGAPLFTAIDTNKDGNVTAEEFKETFAKWFEQWDADKDGFVSEQEITKGLDAAIPRASFGVFSDGGPGGPGGPGGGPGGPGGPAVGGFRRGFGPGGPGGGVQVKGVELDPLVMANDANKPLISKLLAVPALREKYLGYVRQVAEQWLDWEKLGPIARDLHELIAEDVKKDTRKLSSFEDFEKNLTESVVERGPGGGGPGGPAAQGGGPGGPGAQGGGPGGPGPQGGGPGGPGGGPGRGPGGFGGGRETLGIKAFADQRRAYLMSYQEKKATQPAKPAGE